MANSIVGWRAQFVFALCLPIAVLLGYMLAEPTDFTSIAVLLLIIGLLSVPILMYSYHVLLVLTWNAAIMPFFLPGRPFLWMVVAFVGLGFAIINRFTSREARFIRAPSVTWPMLALLFVVLFTAVYRGGFGFRVFGSGSFGGKGYFYILASVVGYFALTSRRIPKQRARLFLGLFFLTGLTASLPNLAWLGGRTFDFVFYLVPTNYAIEQAAAELNPTAEYGRALGMAYSSGAVYCWLMARYGLRGILDLRKPFRLVLFTAASLGVFFCGYRGFMLLFLFTVAAQFFAEKLFQWRNVLILGFCVLLAGAIALPNVDKLPLLVQRSISFLPLKNLDQSVQISAEGSSNWRIQMWLEVLPEIPRYLLVGKGYAVDPAAIDIASRSGGSDNTWALVTGAYHNGPLTLLIPFGIWGLGAFLWLVFASIRFLYRNYRYGDPELKSINTFLLAYFIAFLVYYLLIFGNFYTDFFQFVGIIGLAVSLNGSELQVREQAEEALTAPDEAFAASPAR